MWSLVQILRPAEEMRVCVPLYVQVPTIPRSYLYALLKAAQTKSFLINENHMDLSVHKGEKKCNSRKTSTMFSYT